jgi:hypothetical protein
VREHLRDVDRLVLEGNPDAAVHDDAVEPSAPAQESLV